MTELTPEGLGYKDNLVILMFVHFGLAIAKIILMGFFFGFGDLIQVLILWCGWATHNFCNVFITQPRKLSQDEGCFQLLGQ